MLGDSLTWPGWDRVLDRTLAQLPENEPGDLMPTWAFANSLVWAIGLTTALEMIDADPVLWQFSAYLREGAGSMKDGAPAFIEVDEAKAYLRWLRERAIRFGPFTCPACGTLTPRSRNGQKVYCSNACRQFAYRRRKAGAPACNDKALDPAWLLRPEFSATRNEPGPPGC